jgi:3-oxoacyl-[acyl-carrier protein] reductase
MAQTDVAPDGRKVALVTGGGKGIGATIVRRLSRDKYAVMVNYRSSAEAATALVDELRSDGIEVASVQGDVGDPEQARAIVTATLKAFGRLDLIVNNAGVATFAPLAELTPAALEREFAVNVGGIVWTLQAALPHFSDGGSIINVSSVVAEGGPPGAALYAASKAAVSTLTRTLATELGPRGVRVNAVAPGPVRTDMYASDMEAFFLGRTPLGRIAEPEDIAGVVSALAGEDMAWITGEIVTASGGFRF